MLELQYKSPLHQTISTTPTDFWNDSCAVGELEYAIEHGAVGATSNPTIVEQVLRLERDRWVAWIQGGAYTVQTVEMTETTNSCTGLALVGRDRDFLYRIFIEAESSTILANLEHENPERADEGHGHCKMLDEEYFEVDIRATGEDNVQ